MGNIGLSELLIIFLVALLVFGAKRLPEIARGLGQGIREFRSATREIASELQLDDVLQHPPRRPGQSTPVPRPPVAASGTPPPEADPPVPT